MIGVGFFNYKKIAGSVVQGFALHADPVPCLQQPARLHELVERGGRRPPPRGKPGRLLQGAPEFSVSSVLVRPGKGGFRGPTEDPL